MSLAATVQRMGRRGRSGREARRGAEAAEARRWSALVFGFGAVASLSAEDAAEFEGEVDVVGDCADSCLRGN